MEKGRYLTRKQFILVSAIVLPLLIVLAYFGIFRPVIVMVPGQPGIYVKNGGGMDVLIYRVDGFWYWAGKVALLTNIPDVHQTVPRNAPPVRLQIPEIPVPEDRIINRNTCYMKLAVRYGIPRNPAFRYTTLLYFKYDPNERMWTPTKKIPPKYRSLGNLAVGNVSKIRLNFHQEPTLRDEHNYS